MNFEEYIKQENPRKLASGSVEVSEFWLTFHYPVLRIHSQLFYISVSLGPYSYILKSNENTLWTMDADGNPKRRSVFYHNAKPEIWCCKI
jgi:hypothetical protein